MKDTYTIQVSGITHELPIKQVSDNLCIASFVILGDTELICKTAPQIIEKLPLFLIR